MTDITGVGGSIEKSADLPRFLQLPTSAFHRNVVELHDLVMSTAVEFWRARGLRYVFLPITMNAVSSPMGPGSDSKPVRVRVGEVDTYLADSMQFFLEYACRFHATGAYYVMSSFRGEDTDETHLSQFLHCEAEIAGDLADIMDLVEDFLLVLSGAILDGLGRREMHLPGGTDHLAAFIAQGKAAFTRLRFDDAAELLSDVPDAIRRGEGGGRTLTRTGEAAMRRRLGDFVWVTHWDDLAVPFYQRHMEGRHGVVAANADLVFGPAGEVVGAGERHADGADVRRAMEGHGVDPGDYQWYVDMKDEYPMVTSGFGLGIERLLMWVLQHNDIRDLQILPRDMRISHVP